jgi:hypothetical protein
MVDAAVKISIDQDKIDSINFLAPAIWEGHCFVCKAKALDLGAG